jgi:MoxR-like ATPase
MATQNPLDLVGTYPLPDSQLDRFLLSFSLGYPDPAAERELLTTEDRSRLLDRTHPLLSPADLKALQEDCEGVHVSEHLLDYVQALLKETRDERWFETGLSPRAGLALLRASRALAFLENREFVIPEDIKTIFPSLARHRLSPTSGFSSSAEDQIEELLEQVPIP